MKSIELPCYTGDTLWYDTYIDNGQTCIGRLPHKIIDVRVYFVTEGAKIPLWEIGESAFIEAEPK